MSTRYVAAVAALSLLAGRANAQQTARPARDTVQKLTTINVTAEREDRSSVKPIQLLTLPVTVSITQRRAEETVNLVDAEDAVKYLPSVFLRKRNNGDTQATLATRVWGTSSSARTLIFADGVPLTALVANNNTVGGPRWGLVAPPEIELFHRRAALRHALADCTSDPERKVLQQRLSELEALIAFRLERLRVTGKL